MNKKLMVILQNAYGVEEGYEPSFDKESFANCHTGRRLRKAIPETVSTTIINASPIIGDNSASNFRPDIAHVMKRMREIEPDIILACGNSAKKVIDAIEIDVPIIKMPHPAYRALKNRTLYYIKGRINQETK
jgi:aspartate/glutamate racemase